jgi:hypothetical protein
MAQIQLFDRVQRVIGADAVTLRHFDTERSPRLNDVAFLIGLS